MRKPKFNIGWITFIVVLVIRSELLPAKYKKKQVEAISPSKLHAPGNKGTGSFGQTEGAAGAGGDTVATRDIEKRFCRAGKD